MNTKRARLRNSTASLHRDSSASPPPYFEAKELRSSVAPQSCSSTVVERRVSPASQFLTSSAAQLPSYVASLLRARADTQQRIWPTSRSRSSASPQHARGEEEQLSLSRAVRSVSSASPPLLFFPFLQKKIRTDEDMGSYAIVQFVSFLQERTRRGTAS